LPNYFRIVESWFKKVGFALLKTLSNQELFIKITTLLYEN